MTVCWDFNELFEVTEKSKMAENKNEKDNIICKYQLYTKLIINWYKLNYLVKMFIWRKTKKKKKKSNIIEKYILNIKNEKEKKKDKLGTKTYYK